jgi:hypothetical protein
MDIVLASGPFELDEAEIAYEGVYGREPHIPDMDFECEAFYQWEDEMLHDGFRRLWE